MVTMPTRRMLASLVPLLVMIPFLCGLSACDRAGDSTDNTPRPEVVVYCSADAPIAQPVFDAFEQRSGIRVRAVYDTEATKTTGLVMRLLAEHQAGTHTADVWWSSEPFGSVRLGRAGALEKHTSLTAEQEFAAAEPRGWPASLRAADGTWYGFARRVRVLAYNTKLVEAADVPRELAGLTDPKFKGRIAMARPEFGTTRGHMAALHSLGEEAFRNWLEGVAANGLRLFDGNAAVVRAVASGESWLGLTDSDDALIAQSNGWPVGYIIISSVPNQTWSRRAPIGDAELFPEGAMQIPSTVGLVSGAPHRLEAEKLINFLLSRQAERLLAEGEGHTLPTPRPDERADPLTAPVPASPLEAQRLRVSELDIERCADHIEPAMRLCDQVLKGH